MTSSNVNNSNRFKGSPVTALKDEIDKRYFSNGGLGTLDSGLGSGMEDMDSFPRPFKHKYENEEVCILDFLQDFLAHILKGYYVVVVY